MPDEPFKEFPGYHVPTGKPCLVSQELLDSPEGKEYRAGTPPSGGTTPKKTTKKDEE